MANFNLIGQNLRGKTVTFTFKDMNPFPENVTGDTYTVLSVLDINNDDGIYVKASRVEGNSYGYYDDVQVDTDSWPSVDSYQLSPITYEFHDDCDFIVTAYDPNYVSCDLTEEDLYTTISGTWKINNPSNAEAITSFVEETNFTSNGITYARMYITMRGYVELKYDGDDTTTYVIYNDSSGPNNFNSDFAVIDFGTEPQKVSQHFVRCLSMIAEPMASIKGKWMFTGGVIVSDYNATEKVNFTCNNYPQYTFDQMCMFVNEFGQYIEYGDSVNEFFTAVTLPLNEYNLQGHALIDFGETEQPVSAEFLAAMKKLAICVSDKKISGAWKLKGLIYGGTPASADVEQHVNFRSNNEEFALVLFMGKSWINPDDTPNFVMYQKPNKGQDICVIDLGNDSASTKPEYYVMDFGETEQEVSEDFLIWMAHMAYRVEKISGLWALNETIDFSMIPTSDAIQLFNEQVNFWCDETTSTLQHFVINKAYSGSGEYTGREIVYVDVNNGDVTIYNNVPTAYWKFPRARYIQFSETQYITSLFKQFLEVNAIELGDCAIEPGEYCYKLDPYNAVQEFFANTNATTRSIPIRHTLARKQVDGSDPDEQYTIYVGRTITGSYINSELAAGWYHSISTPNQFSAFGWYQAGSATFQNRHINVLEKTYLTYEQYQFLNKVLIPLNSQRFLDTLGVWETAQSLKTITDLTIKYAKYMKYTPVADVLYYNESGSANVSGLDLSKYLYVSVKARAGSRFIRPTATSFAVQNITDCGGTMELQIADPYNYCVWNVTNTSFTKSDSGSSTAYLIYEIIGYRWDASLDSIPEEPTPTYSYKYIKGQLSCPSGNCFNNYYNSDYGTEFRVELNFRLTTLGVELASNTCNANNYWKLSVNSSGNVVYQQAFSGNSATLTWTNNLQTDKWYSLSLYSNNVVSTATSKSQFNLSVVEYSSNPVHSHTTKSCYYMSQFSTTRNLYIGGDTVDLRDDILVKGTRYHSGVTSTQDVLSVDVADATVGEKLYLVSSSGGHILQSEPDKLVVGVE